MFSVAFLDQLRAAELEMVLPEIRPSARVLEFGAGTGIQAKAMADRGFDVVAIDLADSAYSDDRVYPVIDYDGRTIPLPDASVDVIFSSNVLEHVEDFPRIAAEFRRITRPGGYGVHLMPSFPWRAWTLASGFPNAVVAGVTAVAHLIAPPAGQTRPQALLRNVKTAASGVLPIGHGTSPEAFSELYTFSSHAWRRRFERHGLVVESVRSVPMFHTGHQLFGARLSLDARRRLSNIIGGAANLYLVQPRWPLI